MKASKFSDAQKAFVLKQGDGGVPVAGCRDLSKDRHKPGNVFQLEEEVCGSHA
tara:strand:+ start:271 stop:429 length:159 start_codon:yes stop_codon:yes gene_type:complete